MDLVKCKPLQTTFRSMLMEALEFDFKIKKFNLQVKKWLESLGRV